MSQQPTIPFINPYCPEFDFFNDAYWTNPELAELNASCYHAAVAYPSALTTYFIEEYIDLIHEYPNIFTTPPNVQFRFRFILHHIDYYIRAHANALRCYVLTHRIGTLDPRVLTDDYEEHLRNAPVPNWPWPNTPHPPEN